MSKSGLRLGIDVGGTNSDVVLMRGRDVIASAKSFTTADVKSGVVNAVDAVLAQVTQARDEIEAVMIGTTQFVNAFVQRRDLTPVGIVRVSLPKADGVPPLAGWPDDLIAAVGGHTYMVGGGSFYTGKEYAQLDEEALRQVGADIRSRGLRAVAITSNFAPIRPDIEERAAAIIQTEAPGVHVTLSSKVGGMGLIDRENAAIINASLSELAVKVVGSFVAAFAEMGVHAPIYISQNDGTLITTDVATTLPILTCSAGPTNSVRGAAFLTGIDEAIVADIGGTTTDIGFLVRGFPRETTAATYIGGVRTNFRMPDVLSIGIGGGSEVREMDGQCQVGPTSVGFRLQSEGLVFGGQTMTASDIAVAAGQAAIGDPTLVADIPVEVVESALDAIHGQIEEAIDRIKTSDHDMPLILVGGGSILVSRSIKGATEVLRPPHSEVANAVGAAIALVSGRVDKVYDTTTLGREATLEKAQQEACDEAIAAGALADEVEIVEVTELPMTHMQSGAVNIRVRAVGPLAALA